jgi:hypothetical protein
MRIYITYCNPNEKSAKDHWYRREIDIISQPEKGKQIFYTCGYVLFAHISVHTIQDNADRITEKCSVRN